MRKDIECTFGIMKKRFTVLDKGIDIGTIEKADNVFLTCSALHNLLLDLDERDEVWEFIRMDDDDSNFALDRLHHENSNDNNPQSDENIVDDSPTEYVSDSFTIVRNMHQAVFKKRLVDHFDILFCQNKIVWPKQIKKKRKL